MRPVSFVKIERKKGRTQRSGVFRRVIAFRLLIHFS